MRRKCPGLKLTTEATGLRKQAVGERRNRAEVVP